MANGDPLLVGVTQPPNNRADSATMLVQTGSAFGTQSNAFWVQRLGAPTANAAIRGDNLSAPSNAGVIPTGVTGMVQVFSGGACVFGATPAQPNLFSGEAGVMGITGTFGVVGQSTTGLIVDQPGEFVSGTGVVGECDAGVGVHGVATSGWGIIGESSGRAGVTGKSVTGVGVDARSEQSDGLHATAQNGVGVLGDSVGSIGVFGRSVGGVGVEGDSQQGLAGVHGQSGSLYGVLGESSQGVGVRGTSQNNAVQGWSTGSGGSSIGVSGFSDAGAGVQGDTNTGIAIGGRAPQGWAGYFLGNVVVSGNFFVTNGSKSAAVTHPDGTQRALFCLESPESYFEDFGEVTLTEASVVVKLDQDFAALVKTDKYQVFLTSYGPEALYVRKRGAGEFEIARVDNGVGGKQRKVRVGYRIVARRADLKRARLPKIKLPQHMAEVTKPDLGGVKAKRKPGARLAPIAQLEPLPARPKTPSPDRATLAEADPIDGKGKGKR